MAELKGQKFAIGLSDEPEHLWVCYTVDGIENEFELPNVCNVLGDMLSSLVTLLTNPSQLWDESNAVGFVWYSESDSYNWTLSLAAGGVLRIRITQTCEFFGEDEVELVNTECPVFDFVGCVVKELDRFIKSVGMLNFLQHWKAYEFPTTYFLFLKKHLMDDGLWHNSTDKKGNVLTDESKLLFS